VAVENRTYRRARKPSTSPRGSTLQNFLRAIEYFGASLLHCGGNPFLGGFTCSLPTLRFNRDELAILRRTALAWFTLLHAAHSIFRPLGAGFIWHSLSAFRFFSARRASHQPVVLTVACQRYGRQRACRRSSRLRFDSLLPRAARLMQYMPSITSRGFLQLFSWGSCS